ncbi:MAG: ribonuclease activity regulator RraA [Burkholderiales bacterium]|jgi:regulator of RNase E activity RraA|nr:ribonuclease activity regulator RraA [Burkholderiales bacterium]
MVDDATIDLLRNASTATLATVLSLKGLTRVFMYDVAPLPGSQPRIVGRAFTMRSVSAREDMLALDRSQPPERNCQRRAAEECGAGEVLVIDCRSNARGASGGLILFERMRMRGCAGVVSDGGVRDAADIVATGFPVYAKAVCPPNSLVAHRFIDLQVPVTCGEVAVYPGDVIVGDPDGVIVIPAQIAAAVAAEAVAYERKEEFIIRKIRSGASIYGTYPLTGEGLAEYEALRAAEG